MIHTVKETTGGAIREALTAAEEIRANSPGNRGQILEGIASAKEEQEAAAKAKEEAETEEGYNKACKSEARAKEKEAFFRHKLEKVDFLPRMDEGRYNDLVNAVKATVETAAAEFNEVAEKALDDLLTAKDKYYETIARADEALTDLDEAANVLQVKYRYKAITYTGGLEERREDRDEWLRHAVRFGAGQGWKLIETGSPERDKIISAALKTTERRAY